MTSQSIVFIPNGTGCSFSCRELSFNLSNVASFHCSSAMSLKVRFTESIDCIVECESVSATILSEPFMYRISEVNCDIVQLLSISGRIFFGIYM